MKIDLMTLARECPPQNIVEGSNSVTQQKQLLKEYQESSYTILKERVESPNTLLRVKVLLQVADVKNANGRVYPLSILREQAAKYYNEFVKPRRALGELDHPESSVVALSNVSHNVTDLQWDGNKLWGVLEVLRTPKGEILKSLLESNLSLGVSSRGMGNVRKNNEGVDVVEEGYELLSFDIVSNNSTPGSSFTKENVMNENKKASATPIITAEQLQQTTQKFVDTYMEKMNTLLPYTDRNPNYKQS